MICPAHTFSPEKGSIEFSEDFASRRNLRQTMDGDGNSFIILFHIALCRIVGANTGTVLGGQDNAKHVCRVNSLTFFATQTFLGLKGLSKVSK